MTDLRPFLESRPPLAKGETKSKPMLCLVKTPSFQFWVIGYYDSQYKKDAPWRDIYNHPIRNVTHYFDLPEIPEKED